MCCSYSSEIHSIEDIMLDMSKILFNSRISVLFSFILINSQIFMVTSVALPFSSHFNMKNENQGIVLQLSTGKIRGKAVATEAGNFANVFLGVPYGEPPVNELRFSLPKAKTAWTGILNCSTFGPACLQNGRPDQVIAPDNMYMSEDCLIVNVVVIPSLCSQEHPCPVMSLIHGGAWYFDSPNHLPLDVLIDRWASRGVVVVAPGYRMGVLAFWSTGSDDARGNYVLYDLLESFRWIRKEISVFGGHPSQVSILGYSSSSDAVSQLSLSPLANGLFHRIIAMSGTAYQLPFQDFTEVSKTFAILAGCATSEQWESKNFIPIIACLRNKTGQEVLAVQKVLDNQGLHYNGPRVDGHLLTGSVEELAKNRKPYPLMIGTTLYELGMPGLAELQPNVTAASVASTCRGLVKMAGFKNVDEIVQLCTKKYTSDENYALAVSKLIDDATTFGPTYSDARSMRDAGAPVYLYSFDYVKKGFEGFTPFHAFDVFYIFGLHVGQLGGGFDERDENITTLDLNLITNFAKFGIPTPSGSGEPWKQLENYNYYKIDLPPSNQPLYHYEAVNFWDNVVPHLEKVLTSKSQRNLPEKMPKLEVSKNLVLDNSGVNWEIAFWITLAVAIVVLLCFVGAGVVCCINGRKKRNDFESYLAQEERRALLTPDK